ncbi:MAG: hypothetical protein R2690_04190 [Acidimicrobiales bacterium]
MSVTSGTGSTPNASMALRSSMAAPSNHSITSTRRLDSSGYVCGIATDGRSTSVSNPLKWSIVRASLRRSSSSHSWLRSPASIGSIIWAWAPATRDATRG